MKTKSLLKFFDLSLKEFETYRLLLDSIPRSVAEISVKLDIPRATVYDLIENLEKLDLIYKVKFDNKSKYLSRDPLYLQNLIATKNAKLIADRNELDEASEGLNTLIRQLGESGKSYFQSGMKVLTDKKSVANIYDEVTRAKEVRSFLNSEDMLSIFPENVEKFSDAVKAGTKSWAIFIDNKSSREIIKKHKKEKFYFYKFFPKGFEYKAMDYLIFSDKVVIVERTVDPIAYVIENALLYNNSKALFDLIWELLP